METSEEYCIRVPAFEAFVQAALRVVGQHHQAQDAIAALRPSFSALLWDDGWLPAEVAQPAPNSGMGGGIGQYLLYRDAERTLSISSLVVPAEAMTPVHDHLGWGLVGLYSGEQNEEVFRRLDDGGSEDYAELELVERRRLRRGDFYDLIPPAGDIHRVVAASASPSVSIHLLRNDVGCIQRHAFEPEHQAVKPFRSGYVNAECVSRG